MTKIKTAVSVLSVGVIALTASESTEAALIDRGNGLIYDNVLDVTWAQDLDLSRTLGAGIFNWRGAKAWADQLVYRGYSDWRLPTLTPINGVKFDRIFHCDGSADYGYGIAAPAAGRRDYRQRTCVHVTSILGTGPNARERGHIGLVRCGGPLSACRTRASWMP